MSNIIENVRFRLSLEFLFAIDNNVLDRRLSHDYPQSPKAAPHAEALRSHAALAHLAAILGHDQPEVGRNPDPLSLDTHVCENKFDLDESRWNALEAPQLILSGGVLRTRHNSLTKTTDSHIVGVELLSPRFTFREWQDALQTITRILARLTSIKHPTLLGSMNFKARAPKHLAWTNERCSFRLQFEPLEDDQFFQFRTLQNLIAIWGSFESEIQKLQPLHHQSPPNGPLSLWNNMQKGTPGEVFRREVYASTTLPDLQDIFEFDRDEDQFSKIRLKANPAFPPRVTRCHAIEFREHAGTLNVKDVAFWVGFTAAVLGLCQELTDDGDEFDLDEPISMMGILEVLNASYQAEQYAWNRLIRMADGVGEKGKRKEKGSSRFIA